MTEHRRVNPPASLAFECSMHAACSCGWVAEECGPTGEAFVEHARAAA